jgi:hypothetical protein
MLDIPFSSRYQGEMKKELFIDGVPELLLLRLLAQNEMYGYELVAKIHSISDGAFSFGEGCIYPIPAPPRGRPLPEYSQRNGFRTPPPVLSGYGQGK